MFLEICEVLYLKGRKPHMRSKWYLIGAVFDIIVGVAGVLAFVILCVSGDSVTKWIPALIVAILLLGIGIYDIKQYITD